MIQVVQFLTATDTSGFESSSGSITHYLRNMIFSIKSLATFALPFMAFTVVLTSAQDKNTGSMQVWSQANCEGDPAFATNVTIKGDCDEDSVQCRKINGTAISAELKNYNTKAVPKFLNCYIFSDDDCHKQVLHAGIEQKGKIVGHTRGCTEKQDDKVVWGSIRCYKGCDHANWTNGGV
jgi:hypothetical protein